MCLIHTKKKSKTTSHYMHPQVCPELISGIPSSHATTATLFVFDFTLGALDPATLGAFTVAAFTPTAFALGAFALDALTLAALLPATLPALEGAGAASIAFTLGGAAIVFASAGAVGAGGSTAGGGAILLVRFR
jgi:hypothetical protein